MKGDAEMEKGLKQTSVYFDEGTHRKLRKRAIDEGVTMSEVVRRAVETYLGTKR